jgi:hypothetical protein
MLRTRNAATFVAGIAAIVSSTASMPSPAAAGEAPAGGRYAPRGETTIPAWATRSEIPRGTATVFSPLVSQMVAQMSLTSYEGRLADLCGASSVVIGGSPYTFQTRHSYTSGGQMSWQFAFETLQALGYEVRYQEFTRQGHNLKNVVARHPGQVTPERIYVIGGHIDSTSEQPYTLAPGAEDNASGSAGVLAAAAVLRNFQFESTIELVLFSGEEQGLWGSQAYVQEALAQGRDVRAAATMDMIAYHVTDYGVLIEGETPWQSIMTVMGDAVDSYTDLAREYSYFSFGSDHVPFQDAGIPAFLAIDLDWDEYPYYHRSTDTFDKVDPGFAVKIARAALATAAHLAGPMSAVAVPAVPDPATLAVYPIPARSHVVVASARRSTDPLLVYDLQGRFVRSLPPALDGAAFRWDLHDAQGRPVSPGTYFVQLGREARRIVILP